ncbi:MAG: hypothetical protein ABEI78_00460, partial [Candidatus Nanohaloarchaea archaeon]
MNRKKTSDKVNKYAEIADKLFKHVEYVFRGVIFVAYVFGVVSLIFLLFSNLYAGNLSSLPRILSFLSLTLLVGILLNLFQFSRKL